MNTDQQEVTFEIPNHPTATEKVVPVTHEEDSDDLETSFHSARSTEAVSMRLDAAPFNPNATFKSDSPTEEVEALTMDG